MTEKKNITEKAFVSIHARLSTKNLINKISEETGFKNFIIMDKAIKAFALSLNLDFKE